MAPHFKYQPLSSSNSIRLAHLSHNDKARHGFSLRLAESSLSGETVFNALSYTWGLPYHVDITDLEKPNLESGETFVIPVDNDGGHDSQEVAVTENLFYALRQLIANANGEPITPIWIDAICINQSDEAEKSSQVNMMSEIYSTASSVVVWLGKDDAPQPFLDLHANDALERYLTEVAWGNEDGIPSAAALQRMGLASLQRWQDLWWHYVSFYRRQRYFRRVWIIQETALARDITVLCGSHTLDWTRLVVIGNLMAVSNVANQWSLLGNRVKILMQHTCWTPGNEIRSLHMFRTDHRLNGGLPMRLHQTKANFMRGRQDLKVDDMATEGILQSLGASDVHKEHKEYAYFCLVLRQFSDYQTTDKRDHVFAAVAFCQPFFKKAGVEPPIKPSYKLTVQEVFTQVTAKLLDAMPLLSLLSYVADDKRRVPGLASWVPDFSSPFTHRPLIMRGCVFEENASSDDEDGLDGGGDGGKTPRPVYNASLTAGVTWPPPPGSEPFAVLLDKGHLRVSGTCLGSVNVVCPAAFKTAGELSYLPYLEFVGNELPPVYPWTGEPRSEVFWRTLCGNFSDWDGEYPASFATGSIWFRQHILENVAVMMIASMGDNANNMGVYFAELMKSSALLGYMAADDAGNDFLPNPLELAVQVNTFLSKAFEVINAHGMEGVQNNPDAAFADAATSFGSSPAEMECLKMLGLGMSLIERRLFTTEEGGLGLGPSGITWDDEVWVIRGARVPFVLRRRVGGEHSNEYRLLGEAYLHGAMDGEMLDERGAGIMKITLC